MVVLLLESESNAKGKHTQKRDFRFHLSNARVGFAMVSERSLTSKDAGKPRGGSRGTNLRVCWHSFKFKACDRRSRRKTL